VRSDSEHGQMQMCGFLSRGRVMQNLENSFSCQVPVYVDIHILIIQTTGVIRCEKVFFQ